MKENTKKLGLSPYNSVEGLQMNNERSWQILREKLELDLYELLGRLESQLSHTTTEFSNAPKNREEHLPPLVSTNDIYKGRNGEPECEKVSIREIGERLESDLLRIHDFRPPHTTADRPAHLISYNMIPVPDERGVFMAFLEFLPGDKVSQYYQEVLKNQEY